LQSIAFWHILCPKEKETRGSETAGKETGTTVVVGGAWVERMRKRTAGERECTTRVVGQVA
jgi:hypothetical protein